MQLKGDENGKNALFLKITQKLKKLAQHNVLRIDRKLGLLNPLVKNYDSKCYTFQDIKTLSFRLPQKIFAPLQSIKTAKF